MLGRSLVDRYSLSYAVVGVKIAACRRVLQSKSVISAVSLSWVVPCGSSFHARVIHRLRLFTTRVKWWVYSVSQKIPPWGLVAIFPKRLGICQPNFMCLLCVPIYARQRFFIQLPATVTKLCHIKCEHPACVSVDGGHFEHSMVVTLNMA